jgi:2-hydroxy-3-oxopropionate reductase
MTSRQIAFLGTGLMGAPMAANLLKAGHRLTVWNRSREKAEPLGKLGAEIAASAADAVREANMVITIVSNGEAVADLLFAQGVAAAMQSGAIFIDMSSITPAEARDHAARLQAMGLRHLDAPVSGGTKGAEAATLAIMAGGEEATFDDAAPILKARVNWQSSPTRRSSASRLVRSPRRSCWFSPAAATRKRFVMR